MNWLVRIFRKQSKGIAADTQETDPIALGNKATKESAQVNLPPEFAECYSRCLAGDVWVLAERGDGMVNPLCLTSTGGEKALLLFTSQAKAENYKQAASISGAWAPVRLGDNFLRCLNAVADDDVKFGLFDRDPLTFKFSVMLLIRQTIAHGKPVLGVKELEESRPRLDGALIQQVLDEKAYACLHFAKTVALWLMNNSNQPQSELDKACGKLCAMLALVSEEVQVSSAILDKDAILHKLEQVKYHAMGILGLQQDSIKPHVHYFRIEQLMGEIGQAPPVGIGQPKRPVEDILAEWAKG